MAYKSKPKEEYEHVYKQTIGLAKGVNFFGPEIQEAYRMNELQPGVPYNVMLAAFGVPLIVADQIASGMPQTATKSDKIKKSKKK